MSGTGRGLTSYLRPAPRVSASLCLRVGAPDGTLDSEDFSDSFDADAGDVSTAKKRSLHTSARNDMDKQTKNVEDTVTIIGLLNPLKGRDVNWLHLAIQI